jgi:hypothetical protein
MSAVGRTYALDLVQPADASVSGTMRRDCEADGISMRWGKGSCGAAEEKGTKTGGGCSLCASLSLKKRLWRMRTFFALGLGCWLLVAVTIKMCGWAFGGLWYGRAILSSEWCLRIGSKGLRDLVGLSSR